MALARIHLELDGLTVTGEGVVTITGAPDPQELDPRPALLELLDNLDPRQIEQAAMNRQGWGDVSLAGDIIAVIRDIIEGKPLT